MKTRSNVYTILIISLLFIQQIISGCATTVTKDVQKEELIREAPLKEEVVKEELPEKAAGVDSQKLYEGKCSPCHELTDIGAYSYTPEQWINTIDGMHNPMDYSAFITSEEDEKIKDYLKNMSQKK